MNDAALTLAAEMQCRVMNAASSIHQLCFPAVEHRENILFIHNILASAIIMCNKDTATPLEHLKKLSHISSTNSFTL